MEVPPQRWLQVYHLPERAGAGSCTLAVDDLEALIAHLDRLGIDSSERNSGARVRTVMITDPDGNHLAFVYPTRAELADALRRVLRAGLPLEGASDHGVSEAIYLRDPDGNGVELYWDRPKEQWPRTAKGELNMGTAALDLEDLLTEKRAASRA